jgi:hypothetical protein
MHWPDLQPHRWPRPGSKRAWTVPLALGALAAVLLVLPPWREGVRSEVFNQLPRGLNEDQVIISRAFRHSILVGTGPGAVEIARRSSTKLYDIQLFEGSHLVARLKAGASPREAQMELRTAFADSTVRVFPVRWVVMGDTHMLVTVWVAGWFVVSARAAVAVCRHPAWWRYRAYQVSTLAGLGALLILVFANFSEAFGSFRHAAVPDWLFWIWALVYISLTGGALWFWRYDTRTRCRVCAQALRLPMELGETSSMMLDAPRVELVCFEGHGALTMDRWHDDWRGYRDMWEAFSHPSPWRSI